MFLSFCSVLFSSPVSIQWLCLFLTIPLFRFNPSDVYRATLKWSRVFDLPDNSYHTKKKWRCGKFWSYPRNLIWSIFFSVANRRVMLFRCVTIHELSGDNYLFSYPYYLFDYRKRQYYLPTTPYRIPDRRMLTRNYMECPAYL